MVEFIRRSFDLIKQSVLKELEKFHCFVGMVSAEKFRDHLAATHLCMGGSNLIPILLVIFRAFPKIREHEIWLGAIHVIDPQKKNCQGFLVLPGTLNFASLLFVHSHKHSILFQAVWGIGKHSFLPTHQKTNDSDHVKPFSLSFSLKVF